MYDTRGGVDRNDTSSDAPWIAATGFVNTGYFIETTDNVVFYKVYKKSFLKGQEVHFHGNRKEVTDGAINTNYWAVFKKQGDTASGTASDLCMANPDFTPPAPVTNLRAMPGANSITLSWQNPDDADFAGVVIRRSQVSPPMNVNDGAAPTGTVITSQSYQDAGLALGATYYYTVFSLDLNNNYLIGETVAATTEIDTDGDGLADSFENSMVYPSGLKSAFNLTDSDSDGINDGLEVSNCTDPTNPDITRPVITNFALTSATITFDPLITFNLSGSDDAQIAGWMITQTANPPLSSNVNWLSTMPVDYKITGDSGKYNLYVWLKDAAGNVSSLYTNISVDYTLTWMKTTTSLGIPYSHSSLIKVDNGYVVLGNNYPDSWPIITRIDNFGNIIWISNIPLCQRSCRLG